MFLTLVTDEYNIQKNQIHEYKIATLIATHPDNLK